MKTVFTLIAAGALVALPAAQTLTTGTATYEGTPTYIGNYDIASQTLFPTPPPPLDTVVFANTFANGSYFPSGPGFQNMDFGTLSAGGTNDISAIQIGYATTIQDPGTVDMNVYLNEGATGFGDPGSTITGFSITGLPGSTLGPGLAEAFVVDVTLPGTVNLPDGPIGWTYELTDADTGPLTIGPPNEAGVIDAFDQYSNNFGTYGGTFFFGGVPFASFYMQLTAFSECFLVIGDEAGGGHTFNPGIHTFETQVGVVQDFYPVLLDSIPEFVLPEIGRSVVASGATAGPNGLVTVESDWMADGEFSVQVVMWNPSVFPGQPEQQSHGLFVKVLPNGNVVTRPFGAAAGTGMEVWAETGVNAEGQPVIRFPFSIPGL